MFHMFLKYLFLHYVSYLIQNQFVATHTETSQLICNVYEEY